MRRTHIIYRVGPASEMADAMIYTRGRAFLIHVIGRDLETYNKNTMSGIGINDPVIYYIAL